MSVPWLIYHSTPNISSQFPEFSRFPRGHRTHVTRPFYTRSHLGEGLFDTDSMSLVDSSLTRKAVWIIARTRVGVVGTFSLVKLVRVTL